MKATVTPESGRPSIRTTPWIVPEDVADRKSPAEKARKSAKRLDVRRRMALDRRKRTAPGPLP
jgi:hypothetical protein